MTHRNTVSGATALLGLLAAMATAGCAQTTGEPAYFRSVLIGDRGISVPLPPPSLTDAPKQSVDIEVEIQGDGEFAPDSTLWIVDNEGDLELTLPLDNAAKIVAEGATVDLTSNCLELWIVDGAREGEHTLFSASIAADDQSVTTVPGCG